MTDTEKIKAIKGLLEAGLYQEETLKKREQREFVSNFEKETPKVSTLNSILKIVRE